LGFFDKLRSSLTRTKEQIVSRFEEIVQKADTVEQRSRPIDVDTIEALEEVLISADVGLAATERIVDAVRSRARHGESLRDLVKEEIRRVFDGVERPAPNGHHPHVTMIVGVNGTGKTTTVGKLANLLKSSGQQPLVCAADTFRAAAIEQLEIWAKRNSVEVIKQKFGADPAAVVFDAMSAAKARNADVVLVDTAGRLHTKSNLMSELEKMKRTAAKVIPGAPHDILLVMDATTGQNGLAQAREFTGAVGVTGIVLTKLDGTAKGGIVVAISRELGLPIRFVGTGEQINDMVPFDAESYAASLFD